MKKSVSILFILIFILTLPFSASAKVTDDAYLLTQAESAKLEERSYELINKYDCFVMVCTDLSLGGYHSAEAAANDILNTTARNYGYDPQNGGVIFFVATISRDWQVCSVGKARDMFNDDALDRIEETAVEYLSDGEIYKAFNAYLDVVQDVLEANAQGKEYTQPKKISTLIIYLAVAAAIALIIALIWVSVLKSQLTSVKFNRDADAYEEKGSLNITGSRDAFMYKNVTFIPRPKSSGSSGGRIGGGGGGSRGGKF